MSMTPGHHFRTGLLIGAALIVATLSVPASMSWASPSRRDLAAAKAKLAELNRRLDLMVEQYDQTSVSLRVAQTRLASLESFAKQAQTQADAAQTALTNRVVAAYMGEEGSVLAFVLGSQSPGDFADRLMFVSNLVGRDAEMASTARTKREIALTAAAEFTKSIQFRQALLDQLAEKRTEIQASISEQQALVVKIAGSVAKAEAATRAEAARQAALRSAAPNPTPSTGATSGSTSPTVTPTPTTAPSPTPTPTGGSSGSGGAGPSAAAQIAVRAAYSVLGVPYVWGGDSPSTGFDCSGLTMWAWAQAGVSLPHSSALQYQVIPHISRSQLLPGDLVFFYTPISHVAIYVGNDMMIEAPHTGSFVRLTQFSTYPDFVGAGRPG